MTTAQLELDVAAVPSPLVMAAAVPLAGSVVDARLLVISADGSETELAAIKQTLGYLGTPYDVLVASQAPVLTAAQLGTATHGKYNGVILTTGTLPTRSGGSTVSAFSNAEWQALAAYEATFGVRRAVLYAFPDASYGLVAGISQDTSSTPLVVSCTAAAQAAFPYVNCAAGVTISGAWAYPATATDVATTPLFVDGQGRLLGATRTYADGREALVLTFAQSQYLTHSLQLLYGVVSWATRGVFLGERHTYVGVQVDDLFIADDIYGDGIYRMSPADLQTAFDWQTAKRQQPITAGMRYNFAFNGEGTVEYAPDATAARATQIGAGFYFINHTYDHENLDRLSYNQMRNELVQNAAVATQLGMQSYTNANLVTPDVSGLTNANALRAAFDFGVRYMVTDTSVAGSDNPSPNAGIYNPLQPQILMIPRRPTNLFYNVSTPAQWVAEYNSMYRSYWGRDLSYDEILNNESDVLLQYLLKGENDPWMFHQPDLRDYGSGRSLLGDLLDRTFAKYSGYVTVPLVGPTMDDLGRRVADRMRFNAALASATIDPIAGTIAVSVINAATVPVTGACGASTERYAGQAISYVSLPAGGKTTLSLANGNCLGAGGAGSGGAVGGSGGTGGSGVGGSGVGGSSGTGGSGVGGSGVGGRGVGGSGTGGSGMGGSGTGGSGTGGSGTGGSGTGGSGTAGSGVGGSSSGTGGVGGSVTFSLPCSTLTVAAGSIGSGQTAAALTNAELTGTQDVWNDYVELSPLSAMVCRYNLPSGVLSTAVTALALKVNYRGPDKPTMTWTFQAWDAVAGTWVAVGDNAFAVDWVWTAHTFTLPPPLARFFSAGALQIRYGTSSNADASDVDQLVVTGAR